MIALSVLLCALTLIGLSLSMIPIDMQLVMLHCAFLRMSVAKYVLLMKGLLQELVVMNLWVFFLEELLWKVKISLKQYKIALRKNS